VMRASPAGQRLALVIVILDEGPDLAFEVTRQVIVFQQHTVFHRLVPTFDFSLGSLARADGLSGPALVNRS
jgi:hypothetical protein